MHTKIGPLLGAALQRIDKVTTEEKAFIASLFGGKEADEKLPIVIQRYADKPRSSEKWKDYCERVGKELTSFGEKLLDTKDLHYLPLLAANALAVRAAPHQINQLNTEDEVESLELDPLVQVADMDDVVEDICLEDFKIRHTSLNGDGVRVAVLDSGIDTNHPFLSVAGSVSTCGEDTDIPGTHGTHCGGLSLLKITFTPVLLGM